MEMEVRMLIRCPECQVCQSVVVDSEHQAILDEHDQVSVAFDKPEFCKTCKTSDVKWEYIGIAPDLDAIPNKIKEQKVECLKK